MAYSITSIVRSLGVISLAAGVAACDQDSVLFVTQSQIGIAADSVSQTVNLGYQRHEGVLAPVYSDGEAPPVVAYIDTTLDIFEPKINTLYATGPAALIATQSDTERETPYELVKTGEERKVMVFGTGTSWGLNATYRSQALASMSLGYRRAEVSYIPLIQHKNNDDLLEDSYASVLAGSDLELNLGSFDKAEFKFGSTIATGRAAEKLASAQSVKNIFTGKAENAIQSYAPGETGETLKKADKADPSFRPRLSAWMKGKGIDVSPTLFMNGGGYENDRKQAINDLL